MPLRSEDHERDRLRWLDANVLLRVERNATAGVRISTWLVAGSGAALTLALKTELDDPGTLASFTVWSLVAALVLAFTGAGLGYAAEWVAVRTFNRDRDLTDHLLRHMKPPPADWPITFNDPDSLKSFAEIAEEREQHRLPWFVDLGVKTATAFHALAVIALALAAITATSTILGDDPTSAASSASLPTGAVNATVKVN